MAVATGLLYISDIPDKSPCVLHDHPQQRLAPGHHLPDSGASHPHCLRLLAPHLQLLQQNTEVRQDEVSLSSNIVFDSSRLGRPARVTECRPS